MIRPITLLSALLTLFAGFYVFYAKHQGSLLDARIERTVKQSQTVREHIRLLQADWAVQSAPDRLKRLADQYLTLQPTAPSQFATFATLTARLPATRTTPDQTNDAGAVAAVGTVPGPGSAPGSAPGTGPGAGRGGATPTAVAASSPAGSPPASAAASVGAAALGPAPTQVARAHPPVPVAASPIFAGRGILAGAPVRLTRAPAAASPAGHAAILHPAPPRPAPHLMARQFVPAPRPYTPRLVPAGYRPPVYRAPAYRAPPRPVGGVSMLGMARGAGAGPAPPAPLPYQAGNGD